ncbi:hypothetical protein HUN01_22020 [Nostoc edaphicum CCNP1411]|uniref:Uncharacterized protein n=1 Tax=Nostoc edaphicum CCNP1411 TaxID=1472755 RepID=A0A7D7LCQ0_9NOSO|nr:hypothetical protein [Nostoc edaphicum]QMS90133.1 hypothetical protein HUN01_22020 [Nostoc edaphicum CCNP1411]
MSAAVASPRTLTLKQAALLAFVFATQRYRERHAVRVRRERYYELS